MGGKDATTTTAEPKKIKGLCNIFGAFKRNKNNASHIKKTALLPKKGNRRSTTDDLASTTTGTVDGSLLESPKQSSSPIQNQQQYYKQPLVDLTFLSQEAENKNLKIVPSNPSTDDDSTLLGLAYDLPSLGSLSESTYEYPSRNTLPMISRCCPPLSLGSVSESTDPNEVSIYDDRRYNRLGACPAPAPLSPVSVSSDQRFLFQTATDYVTPLATNDDKDGDYETPLSSDNKTEVNRYYDRQRQRNSSNEAARAYCPKLQQSSGSISEATDPNEVSMYDDHRYNKLGAEAAPAAVIQHHHVYPRRADSSSTVSSFLSGDTSLGSVSEATDPNEVSMYDDRRYNKLGAAQPSPQRINAQHYYQGSTIKTGNSRNYTTSGRTASASESNKRRIHRVCV